MDAQNKVALITGASRRIGRAIALELAQAGCDICIHCHTSASEAEEVGREVSELGRRSAVIQGDLNDLEVPAALVEQAVAALGRLDILVNNASVFDPTPLLGSQASAWERTFRINAIAPALLMEAAVPLMRAAGQGRIVNLLDVLAERPIRRFAAYCASKAALAALTKSMALELAPTITVNGIAPGIAVFPEEYAQELRSRLVAQVPLGRKGSPEEVAQLVRFLITTGDYITGQTIAIDGGWLMT